MQFLFILFFIFFSPFGFSIGKEFCFLVEALP
jgi:hypothetical protein